MSGRTLCSERCVSVRVSTFNPSFAPAATKSAATSGFNWSSGEAVPVRANLAFRLSANFSRSAASTAPPLHLVLVSQGIADSCAQGYNEGERGRIAHACSKRFSLDRIAAWPQVEGVVGNAGLRAPPMPDSSGTIDRRGATPPSNLKAGCPRADRDRIWRRPSRPFTHLGCWPRCVGFPNPRNRTPAPSTTEDTGCVRRNEVRRRDRARLQPPPRWLPPLRRRG